MLQSINYFYIKRIKLNTSDTSLRDGCIAKWLGSFIRVDLSFSRPMTLFLDKLVYDYHLLKRR